MKTFLGAALLGVTLLAHAQSVSTDSDAAAGARQSLSALGGLVTEQNAQQLGFESPRQAAGATLGQPFPAYLVRLDELRAWHPGASADALLKPLDRLIYPVLVDGKVRSSVTVEKGPTGWRAVGFGSPLLIQRLAEGRDVGVRSAGVPENAVFAVQVPALAHQYVAWRVAGKLMLLSITDDTDRQHALPAEQVFDALAPIARAYNGLPL